jgi:hypothetical protein
MGNTRVAVMKILIGTQVPSRRIISMAVKEVRTSLVPNPH